MTSLRTVAIPCAAVLFGAASLAPAASHAQRARPSGACCAPVASVEESPDSTDVAVPAPRALFTAVAAGGTVITQEEARRRARWAPLASAVLPGSGQALLQQQRFLPYLALEGYALLQVLADSREGQRQLSAYRDLAAIVARAPLSPVTPNGDWEYYEKMEHYVSSGAYDVQPGGALEPEPDTTTYNGSVWLLARQTYWVDPSVPPPAGTVAYESAVAFYRQRAVTPAYRWSWENARLEQDVFRRTIARSNDAYRRAAQDLAVLIANHVLSTVDAFVTVRLRQRRAGGDARRPASAEGESYSVTIALPMPRSGAASP